jgi:hypothetical protein
VTSRFCECVGVLAQLRALGGQVVKKEDDAIKWLRRWLRNHFGAHLVCQGRKTKCYTIDTQQAMDIVRRRNPDLMLPRATTCDTVTVRLPERYQAFARAFSPRLLPALVG